MLNPGTVLFLCVVAAGCNGSLRELRAQLRAKRARALGLQVDECYGEQGGNQCGFSYPEDQETPRNWAQQQQVSLPQPDLLQAVPGQSYPGQDGSQRFPGHPGMEPGHGFQGQNPMNQQLPGQHQNFPGMNPMVHLPGQGPSCQNFPGHSPANPDFPSGPPTGPAGPRIGPEGLPPGVNAPYCFTEDGQPRFPGMAPGMSPGMASPQSEFGRRWRSPLPTQPDEHQTSMAPGNPNSYQFPVQQDQSFEPHQELPGAKLRKRLDDLFNPPKQPSSKYSPHLSTNYHHPQMPQAPKFGDVHPPKMNYPKFSDVMRQSVESEAKSTDLPSEWTRRSSFGRSQPNYERPSTTTTPKPLSTFFSDFMPKYVETVPPPSCPASHLFQQVEQQQAAPEYEQPEPHQPSPYGQPLDHHTSQDHSPSPHHYDSPSSPHYGHRPLSMPKPFRQH